MLYFIHAFRGDRMLKITGKVIKGQSYGQKIGFPTANLDRRQYRKAKQKIKLGVWAGYAHILSKRYKAGVVIGPFDQRGLPKIEAHLLAFRGNLYGKTLQLTLTKYLRPFKKFSSETVLKTQIKKDILQIRKILK